MYHMRGTGINYTATLGSAGRGLQQAILLSEEGKYVVVPLVTLVASSSLVKAAAEGQCPCQEVGISLSGFPYRTVKLLGDFVSGRDVKAMYADVMNLLELCTVLGINVNILPLQMHNQKRDTHEEMELDFKSEPLDVYDVCEEFSDTLHDDNDKIELNQPSDVLNAECGAAVSSGITDIPTPQIYKQECDIQEEMDLDFKSELLVDYDVLQDGECSEATDMKEPIKPSDVHDANSRTGDSSRIVDGAMLTIDQTEDRNGMDGAQTRMNLNICEFSIAEARIAHRRETGTVNLRSTALSIIGFSLPSGEKFCTELSFVALEERLSATYFYKTPNMVHKFGSLSNGRIMDYGRLEELLVILSQYSAVIYCADDFTASFVEGRGTITVVCGTEKSLPAVIERVSLERPVPRCVGHVNMTEPCTKTFTYCLAEIVFKIREEYKNPGNCSGSIVKLCDVYVKSQGSFIMRFRRVLSAEEANKPFSGNRFPISLCEVHPCCWEADSVGMAGDFNSEDMSRE